MNDVSLREYVDTRLAAAEKAVSAALAAADRAVSKAEMAAERRFEAQNEFRGTLTDQARLFMPRVECENSMRGLSEKIDLLNTQMNASKERANTWAYGWGLMVGIIG